MSLVLEFPNEIMGLVNRLVSLPEFGMDNAIAQIQAQCDKAIEAERIASEERKKAHDMADKLFRAVKKNWTRNEIYQATGYEL